MNQINKCVMFLHASQLSYVCFLVQDRYKHLYYVNFIAITMILIIYLLLLFYLVDVI